MSSHIKGYRQYQKSIEYKSSDPIIRKPNIFRIMRPYGIDDMEQHYQNIQRHAKGDRHNEYGVQLADERQIRHCIHRP